MSRPGFEQWPPASHVRAPDTEPPADLRALIQEYATLGGSEDSFVQKVADHPAWSFTELQLGKNWADYLMDCEIAKIRIKIQY